MRDILQARAEQIAAPAAPGHLHFHAAYNQLIMDLRQAYDASMTHRSSSGLAPSVAAVVAADEKPKAMVKDPAAKRARKGGAK